MTKMSRRDTKSKRCAAFKNAFPTRKYTEAARLYMKKYQPAHANDETLVDRIRHRIGSASRGENTPTLTFCVELEALLEQPFGSLYRTVARSENKNGEYRALKERFGDLPLEYTEALPPPRKSMSRQQSPLGMRMTDLKVKSPELMQEICGETASADEKRIMDHQLRVARAGYAIPEDLSQKANAALDRIEERRRQGGTPPATHPAAQSGTERATQEPSAAATVVPSQNGALRITSLGQEVVIRYEGGQFVDASGKPVIFSDEEGQYIKVRPDPEQLVNLVPKGLILKALMGQRG